MQVTPNTQSLSIKNKSEFELHPQLKELLDALWLKNPAFVFEEEKNHRMDNKIHKCNVLLGYEKLGYVKVDNVYTRNGYVMMWHIGSPHIRKSRGDANVSKSKNLRAALQIALKNFTATDKNLQAVYILKAAYNGINMVTQNAVRPFHRHTEQYGRTAFKFCLNYFTGNEKTLPKQLTDVFESESFKDIIDNQRIAKSVWDEFSKAKSGVVIKVERDDTINVADVSSETMMLSVKSTYDLPKNYQEKFAILKVMEHDQPVMGIGIKVQSETRGPISETITYYYLVGGDTPIIN